MKFSFFNIFKKSSTENVGAKYFNRTSFLRAFIAALLSFCVAIISLLVIYNTDNYYNQQKKIFNNAVEYEIKYDDDYFTFNNSAYVVSYSFTDVDGNFISKNRGFDNIEDVLKVLGKTKKIKYNQEENTVFFLPYHLSDPGANIFLCILIGSGILAVVFGVILFGKHNSNFETEPAQESNSLIETEKEDKQNYKATFKTYESIYDSDGQNKFRILFSYEDDGMIEQGATDYCYSYQEVRNLQKSKTLSAKKLNDSTFVLGNSSIKNKTPKTKLDTDSFEVKQQSEEVSYCIHCGAKNPKGSKFCIHCGAEQE